MQDEEEMDLKLEIDLYPDEIDEIPDHTVILDSLPSKSKLRYQKEKKSFLNWCQEKNEKSINEKILLNYFTEKATTLKCSTLWCMYSMLRSTLALEDNIDISKFKKLITFLKQKSVGYRPEKSLIFSKDDIAKFLKEAPDEDYLLMKVVFILGVAGACRREELLKLAVEDIIDNGSYLIVKLPDNKHHIPRTFTVTIGADYCRKYVALRDKNTPHRRLFVFYRKGKCTVQPVGINTFGKIPEKIARYLQKSNPSQYTGHCFRGTSAKLSVNEGLSFLTIKKETSTVTKDRIAEADTVHDKIDITKRIKYEVIDSGNELSASNLKDVTVNLNMNHSDDGENTIDLETVNEAASSAESISNSITDTNLNLSGILRISFNNCTSCTFNITVNK